MHLLLLIRKYIAYYYTVDEIYTPTFLVFWGKVDKNVVTYFRRKVDPTPFFVREILYYF